MNQFDTGHHLEQLSGQMGSRSGARRCHVDLTRISLGMSYEFGNRLECKRWVDRQGVGDMDHARDWRDVADEIEIQPFVKRRIDRARGTHEEKRVAVRGRAHDHLGGDIGGRAWPVFNDKWLTVAL